MLNKRCVVVFLAIALFIGKLYILHDALIVAKPGSLRDDLLMVKMANSILQGEWLGEYSEFTFIKGVTYPLFLSFCCVLHIPAIIANSSFYALSVVAFVFAIKPLVNNYLYLFLIYVILILSPVSYATLTVAHIYRDDIYYSLILILVSCYVAIIARGYNAKVKFWLWLLTLDFIAVMFCREDSIWIVPIMVAVSLYFVKKEFDLEKSIKKTRKILLMPFVGVLIAYVMFGMINFFVYGKFIINEFQYSSFSKAYALLCNIDTKENISKVKLSNEAIQKAYEVSPTFSKLKSKYDGATGDMWRGASKQWNGDTVPVNEMGASHSMWAFRNCVSELGYYDSPQHADSFYNAVIEELENANKNGQLKMKEGFNIPLFSSLSSDEWMSLWNNYIKTLIYVIKEDKMYLNTNVYVRGRHDDIMLFEEITHSKSFQGFDLQGWAISKKHGIKLSVVGKESGRIYRVNNGKGEDVREYYLAKGVEYPSENIARFFVELPFDEKMPVVLKINDGEGHLLKSIAIDESALSMGTITDENVIYNIEDFYVPILDADIETMKSHADVTMKISGFWSKLNFVAMIISLVMLVMAFGCLLRKDINREMIVVLFMWGVLLLRIFVIAYNTTTAFYSISYGYLSPCYPIMSAIIGVNTIVLIEFFRKKHINFNH